MSDFYIEAIPGVLEGNWSALRARIIHELKEMHRRGYDRGYDAGYVRGMSDAKYEERSR